MKKACLNLTLFLAVACCAFAADDARLAALTAADTERVAAIVAGDKDRLNAIFSDELHYAHSNGVVDTKSSFMDALVSGRSKYLSCDYVERKFTFPAPTVALMSGRARIKVKTATAEMDSILSFLAVFREENGKWRFLAWQSCKVPPPDQKK
ncbi:MAG TPA: nuclear transport factor 2 family protein [Planctomycetota bacterium]|nr:nuclear transport factor 2 family protein [Planctomycetota bacterium]